MSLRTRCARPKINLGEDVLVSPLSVELTGSGCGVQAEQYSDHDDHQQDGQRKNEDSRPRSVF
jgi:hypothetical protein